MDQIFDKGTYDIASKISQLIVCSFSLFTTKINSNGNSLESAFPIFHITGKTHYHYQNIKFTFVDWVRCNAAEWRRCKQMNILENPPYIRTRMHSIHRRWCVYCIWTADHKSSNLKKSSVKSAINKKCPNVLWKLRKCHQFKYVDPGIKIRKAIYLKLFHYIVWTFLSFSCEFNYNPIYLSRVPAV